MKKITFLILIFLLVDISNSQCCVRFSPGTKKCIQCPPGMHLFKNNCIFDVDNCIKYSDGFVCSQCDSRYSLNQDKECQKIEQKVQKNFTDKILNLLTNINAQILAEYGKSVHKQIQTSQVIGAIQRTYKNGSIFTIVYYKKENIYHQIVSEFDDSNPYILQIINFQQLQSKPIIQEDDSKQSPQQDSTQEQLSKEDQSKEYLTEEDPSKQDQKQQNKQNQYQSNEDVSEDNKQNEDRSKQEQTNDETVQDSMDSIQSETAKQEVDQEIMDTLAGPNFQYMNFQERENDNYYKLTKNFLVRVNSQLNKDSKIVGVYCKKNGLKRSYKIYYELENRYVYEAHAVIHIFTRKISIISFGDTFFRK